MKAPNIRHQWRSGSRVPRSLTADVAAAEFDRIRQEQGSLTAKIVVDEARPKAAPLHPAFEWNNSRAGEMWREYQARNLIAAVQVVTVDRTSRAFIHVSPEPPPPDSEEEKSAEGSYERLAVVVADDGMLKRAMAELIARLVSAQEALDDVRIAADKVSAKAVELREIEEMGTALLTALTIARRRK